MKKILPIVLVLVIVFALASSLFTIKEGQTAILLQFGHVEEANYKPGIAFKIPFVQQVVKMDGRIQSFDAQPERYFTKEKKSVDVDFYVKWRIADTVRFYKATSGNTRQALQRLAPIIKDALRFQVNSRTLEELISGARHDIAQEAIDQANKTTIDNLGIKVVDVRIKRIELPETVSESVYNRMRAERKQLANELRSTGKEVGETVRADADRKSQILIANAKRDATNVRGEGDAKAAAIYAKAYSKNPQFFSFYRSLRAYRKTFGQGNTTFILDPDSPFLHYLDQGGKAAAD